MKRGRPAYSWKLAAKHLDKLNTNLKDFSESKVLKINGRIESDDEQCNFSSITFCDNGVLLAADSRNNKLKLLETSGRLLNVLDLDSCPHSVEVLDGKVALISLPDIKTIRVVSTKTNTLVPQQDITRRESGYWLARNGVFGIVQCGDGVSSALFHVHPEGRVRRLVQHFPFNSNLGICFDSKRDVIYVMDADGSAVQCVNKGGEIVRSLPLEGYTKLGRFCRTEDGHFYICASFQVLKVNVDGKVEETLSTGTVDPLAVSVNLKGTMLAVAGDTDTITVYTRC